MHIITILYVLDVYYIDIYIKCVAYVHITSSYDIYIYILKNTYHLLYIYIY